MAMLSLHLMVGIAGLPRGARGQEAAPSEYQMKAAFLYNFAKFVEWPPTALPEHSALVIGVLGDDPFDGVLENILRNKNVAGHPLAFRPVKSLDEAQTCQILFISSSEKKRWAEISAALAGSSVLTVSENDHFTDNGGMIYFFMEDRRVCFDINAEAARRAGLTISSKLMLLRKKPPA
jgi:hypothetical protein